MNKLDLLPLNQVQLKDLFWDKYISLVTKEIIPYQWEILNDRVEGAEPSHCISNFKVAAGLKKGTFEGAVFQDTDVAKWLEAAAYSLSYEKNEELEKTADEVIRLIGKAQQPDGYINTHFTILAPKNRWANLREGHELYTAGHLLEAAVAYYKVTGKTSFLDIMIKFADLICQVFSSERYSLAVPGHQEIEIGLIKLYEVTGDRKYLNQAKAFIDRRGTKPNYLVTEHNNPLWMDIFHDRNPFDPAYSQCHKPVREQSSAEGHAVRAVYMYCAMADLAYEYKDDGLLAACKRLWSNIAGKRMYITGGIGSSGAYERFTTDYHLPNTSNYSETCASIGLALFSRRMAQITREGKYADVMERALYNTVLAGIAMDGKSFFYVNPLEVWPPACMDHTSMEHVKPVRQKWFGVACCPPNIARTLASMGEYTYFREEDSLWVNLFISGKVTTEFSGKTVAVIQKTGFPFEGKTQLFVEGSRCRGNIYLRIPGYAKNVSVTVDGILVNEKPSNGYLRISGVWEKNVIELAFDMPARFVHANPRVHEDAGKAAILKGPLVYCLEEVDNGENLAGIFVDTKEPLTEKFEPDLLGGTLVITAKGKRIADRGWTEEELYRDNKTEYENTELKAVPYCYWGNRKTGEMCVWIKEIVSFGSK